MKRFRLYIAAAGLMALTAACSEENFGTEGTGSVALSTTVSTDMEVVSRATDQALAENCLVWISGSKGLVREYKGIDNVPAQIDLVAGHYVAEAWTGDSVAASWNDRWFKGRQEFDVRKGQTESVNLKCKIGNVGVTANFAEGIEEVLTDITLTVGHKGGSLVFSQNETRMGYFMMPSADKDLAYELKGKLADGKDLVIADVIADAAPATHYILNVTYSTPESNDKGGALFTIKIDRTEIEVTQDITLTTPPVISGLEFNIANAITGESGSIGDRFVYVASALQLKALTVSNELFADVPGDEGNTCSLLDMSSETADALRAKGFGLVSEAKNPDSETLLRLDFTAALTNSLPDGEHRFVIAATDTENRTTEATLLITISDAPVVALPVVDSEISHFSATLRGTVAKDNVESIGFRYRRQGDTEWQYVEGTVASRAFAKGQEFTATITGLTDGSTYEYSAASGDFYSAVMTFETISAQLPNSSFEIWSMGGKDNKVVIPGADLKDFWDSGNHGSATMNKNITDKSTAYKHSGEYSAMLRSQFVGMMGIGKFAAGNVFAGNYLYTDGFDGELGWGRPWTLSPKEVKVWVRYEPGTVASGKDKGSGDYMPVGATDQGIVYIALVDDTKEEYTQSKSDFKNTWWPQIVRTKAANRQLFDKDGANVIGYGEMVLGRTEADGMIQITIPIDYKRPGETPSNIIFVASASRYGDYFQGGEGSTLYIDDIELVY